MASRNYTLEFKKQAVALAVTLGSMKKAADQLGIPKVNISAWKKQLSEPQLSDKKIDDMTIIEELRRLKRENTELIQVNLILKTATAFFSQDHLKKNIG